MGIPVGTQRLRLILLGIRHIEVDAIPLVHRTQRRTRPWQSAGSAGPEGRNRDPTRPAPQATSAASTPSTHRTAAQPSATATSRQTSTACKASVPSRRSCLTALSWRFASLWAASRTATHGAGRAAFDYLERNACRSRAGAGGRIPLDGEGFVGAVFPHRFSREGDPQIHVHCLAANMTMCGGTGTGAERAWRTLNAHPLYQHQKTAGYLFQAELRERLTERLGVEWTDVHKGAARGRRRPEGAGGQAV
ncbi:MAG: relaxase domain-containing protein [Thermoleophilaceae bacterium]